jgi:hypothetical protein
MSKTQDKRALRKAEAEEFVRERRKKQIAIFESNFEAGIKYFEENKDKMSEEEIAIITLEIQSNLETIEEFKKTWNV